MQSTAVLELPFDIAIIRLLAFLTPFEKNKTNIFDCCCCQPGPLLTFQRLWFICNHSRNQYHTQYTKCTLQSECDIDLSFLAAVASQGAPQKPGPSFVSHTLTDCLQETSFRKVKIQLDAFSFLAPASPSLSLLPSINPSLVNVFVIALQH